MQIIFNLVKEFYPLNARIIIFLKLRIKALLRL